ncbi:MAG: hypothetical protein AB1714_05780 [Acidobacteriota bacterium]
MATYRVSPKDDVAKLRAPQIVELAQKGFKPSDDLDDESIFHYRYELLRRLVGEDERPLWQAISEQTERVDRHKMIWCLWGKIVQSTERLEEFHHSESYHRRYMFDWLLERYDLPRAREAFVGSSTVRYIHWLLLLLMFVCLWARSANPLVPWLVPLLYVGCALLLWARGRNTLLPLGLCVQSFIPRLAGTAVVGYLFLVAGGDFMHYISRHSAYVVAAVCVAASFGYLVLEIGHRSHPQPRPSIMMQMSLDILCIGACHSLALVVIGGAALAEVVELPATAPILLSWAAVILLIGLVLNVIWAEEPVTRPL